MAFFSSSVLLFNGVILPVAFKVKMLREQKKQLIWIILNLVLLFLLFVFMLFTTYNEGANMIGEIFKSKSG